MLSLILLIPYGLKRIKEKLPQFIKNNAALRKTMAIKEILPVDPKRKVVAVSVQDNGKEKTMLLLTGGTNDLFIGWLDEKETGKSQAEEIKDEDNVQH